VFDRDWCYVAWGIDMLEFQNEGINVLELQVVYIAAEKWDEKWSGKHIVVRSDNASTVSGINKGTSRSVHMLGILQKLFWLSVKYGFKLSAVHLPGRLNILSDRISRLHEITCACEAKNYLTDDSELGVSGHMTYQSYVWLQGCWGMS
jgi:hypothetical protein